MVLHPLLRIPDLANTLGLMFGAFGIYLVGYQLKKRNIENCVGYMTSCTQFSNG